MHCLVYCSFSFLSLVVSLNNITVNTCIDNALYVYSYQIVDKVQKIVCSQVLAHSDPKHIYARYCITIHYKSLDNYFIYAWGRNLFPFSGSKLFFFDARKSCELSLERMAEGVKVSTDKFIELFGCKPDIGAFAPGRVNLIGEHVDYK